MLIKPIFMKPSNWFFNVCLLFGYLFCLQKAFAVSFDPTVATARFEVISATQPTIIRGTSGTQILTVQNKGPDSATGAIATITVSLATGVTVGSVTSSAGACTGSGPYTCTIGSVSNGATYTVSIVYNVSMAAVAGTSQQMTMSMSSNEYNPGSGAGESLHNVWGAIGAESVASQYGSFWVGRTSTTADSGSGGLYSSCASAASPCFAGTNALESNPILSAWPVNQANPTGRYLYQNVVGQANDRYFASAATTTDPTINRVVTNMSSYAYKELLLSAAATASTSTINNQRAWQFSSYFYIPTTTNASFCVGTSGAMIDDGAYISIRKSTDATRTIVGTQRDSYIAGTPYVASQTLDSGYYEIVYRMVNQNNFGNFDTAQGRYGPVGMNFTGGSCNEVGFDSVLTAGFPTYIQVINPPTLQLAKAWGANSSVSDSASIGATTGGTNNTTLFSTAGGTAADSGAAVAITVGNTITFPAETGTNIANYNTVLSCTADGGATANALSGTNGQVSNTLVIGAGDASKAIVCTYTNTRKSATLRLAKAWGVNSIANNVANIGATTGFVNNTTAFNSTASTASNSNTVTVFAGETATLPAETMSTGTLANYTTTLSCDNGVTPSGTNGQSSNTITIPNTVTGLVTCTYTNTRIAQNLTLVKQWTNAATGHTATVTTTGGTNNSSFNSTAPSTNTTGTTVTVYAGDVVTLPAEMFDGGASASNYITTLACTGGSTLASGAVGRTLTISNTATATTCTYTNTGLSDMVPSLTYMPNTGIVGSPYYGKFSCTNSGIAPATAGATCAITLPAGLSATCSPTVPTASTVAVNATINCTVTGTPTTAVSDTLVLTTGATNDSNGGTTNGGNNQVTQAITITDPTATAMCSSGSATNLLSAAGTEIYHADNTNTPITNSFGLIASPATYVRTGSNFVVKGNWRWRNANPASGSPAMTYQLIVNGTAYAQLVGTPSGQEVGTLTALNGATLDGGLSTMQLYDFSVSGLAALPVSVTLPSTVTTISTLSMSFVSSTTPADDAGLAPTLLNACALPKLTITKVSNGGVGGFSFTGNNGFTNETITTTVAGTGVVGTTQTLSAVSTTTIISETIPSGYTVTDISCTGLGSGSATPNLATGTVTLSDTAVVYGANLACTFTNTATITNYILSGKVFLDNGKNAATPHNGVQEVDELGLGNITVRLTDCASTVYQTGITNGLGSYSLTIPSSLTAGTTLCVAEQPTNGLISVSGVAGTTGGSYNLASDRTQFTLAVATNYTGVDFGNVAESQLTGTGNQTIAAGTTASYSHQFISGTEGLVTFSTAQAPTPALTWTSLVYVDTNCNALLDGGDTQVTAPIAVVAEQVVCLLQKVQSPSTAANGSQDVSTISASFAFTAPSAITRLYNQNDTTIIMDSGLVLVKKVRQVSSCPSTAGDTNPFVTNNQALPNALIEYQISYSNPSSGVVSNVVINDITPSFTTFRSANCQVTPPSVLCGISSAPSVGGVGAIQWNIANNPVGLTSGHSGDVRFCVRVDQ